LIVNVESKGILDIRKELEALSLEEFLESL
jgi:hypothetical protein